MDSGTVLLINHDPSLAEFFQKMVGPDVLSTRVGSAPPSGLKAREFPLVILEKTTRWPKDLRRWLGNGTSLGKGFIIIGPSAGLKNSAEHIRDFIPSLVTRPPGAHLSPQTRPGIPKKDADLPLHDWIEKRLVDFVKQMKTSGGRNLYSILLREIEAPLIRIALKETNGNQIQAAHLLGMNRNTLRKKIKALKIPLPRSPGRKNGKMIA